jgi:hypothetical protein
MGMTTMLHGYIYAPGEAAELNAARIRSLPDDDKIIYLTPDLFALPNLMENHSYNDQLITFGTLYKNFEPGGKWDQWREKFEALLRTMNWGSARVYLDVEADRRFQYDWEATWPPEPARDPADTTPSWLRQPWIPPIEEWTFTEARIGDSEL